MSTWETLHYHSPALKNQGQGGPHPRIAVANCTALMSHREAGFQQGHANYTSARHVGGIRAPNPPTSSCQRRRGSASKIKTVFTVPELAGNKTVFCSDVKDMKTVVSACKLSVSWLRDFKCF